MSLETLVAGTAAGKTLTLPPGYTGGGYVRNVVRNPPILVLGDGSQVLTDVKLQGSKGIVFENVQLACSGAGFALAFTAGSGDGGVRNCKAHGPKGLMQGGGVSIADSSNVFVTGCDIGDLGGCLNVLRSPFVTVTNNKFHDFSVDACQFNGSSDATITGNETWNSFPVPGAHNDGLQFFTYNTTTPTRNITIKDNIFIRGEGQVFQGVFMGNEVKIPYENVTITGNIMLGTMYHGIAIYQVVNLDASDNVVTGFPDMKSWILLSQATGRIVNSQAQEFNFPAVIPGLTQSGNVVIPAATDGGAALLAEWRKNHQPAPPSPPPPPSSPPPPPPPVDPCVAEKAALAAAEAKIIVVEGKLASAEAQVSQTQKDLNTALTQLIAANDAIVTLKASLAVSLAEVDQLKLVIKQVQAAVAGI